MYVVIIQNIKNLKMITIKIVKTYIFLKHYFITTY